MVIEVPQRVAAKRARIRSLHDATKTSEWHSFEQKGGKLKAVFARGKYPPCLCVQVQLGPEGEWCTPVPGNLADPKAGAEAGAHLLGRRTFTASSPRTTPTTLGSSRRFGCLDTSPSSTAKASGASTTNMGLFELRWFVELTSAGSFCSKAVRLPGRQRGWF